MPQRVKTRMRDHLAVVRQLRAGIAGAGLLFRRIVQKIARPRASAPTQQRRRDGDSDGEEHFLARHVTPGYGQQRPAAPMHPNRVDGVKQAEPGACHTGIVQDVSETRVHDSALSLAVSPDGWSSPVNHNIHSCGERGYCALWQWEAASYLEHKKRPGANRAFSRWCRIRGREVFRREQVLMSFRCCRAANSSGRDTLDLQDSRRHQNGEQ